MISSYTCTACSIAYATLCSCYFAHTYRSWTNWHKHVTILLNIKQFRETPQTTASKITTELYQHLSDSLNKNTISLTWVACTAGILDWIGVCMRHRTWLQESLQSIDKCSSRLSDSSPKRGKLFLAQVVHWTALFVWVLEINIDRSRELLRESVHS